LAAAVKIWVSGFSCGCLRSPALLLRVTHSYPQWKVVLRFSLNLVLSTWQAARQGSIKRSNAVWRTTWVGLWSVSKTPPDLSFMGECHRNSGWSDAVSTWNRLFKCHITA